jgi:hypothetical protein
MHAELIHALSLGSVDRQKLRPVVIAGPIAHFGLHPYRRQRKGRSKFDATWSPILNSAPAKSAIPPSLSEVPRPSKIEAFMARETITRMGTLTLYLGQRRMEVESGERSSAVASDMSWPQLRDRRQGGRLEPATPWLVDIISVIGHCASRRSLLDSPLQPPHYLCP